MQCPVAIQLDCFVAPLLAMTGKVQAVFAALAIHRRRGTVRLLFFDWFAPSPITFPFWGCSGFYPWFERAAACRESWVSR